jgi:hypothetical protein
MAIADQDELIETVQVLLGDSYDKISGDGYEKACVQAETELGWTFPLADARKCYWLVERARRHTIYVLMVESAHKFQYKQIHLEHRFNHYIKLVERMDAEFVKALEDFPELFDGIDGGYDDFAYYINPGFVYNSLGRDITYS